MNKDEFMAREIADIKLKDIKTIEDLYFYYETYKKLRKKLVENG